MQGKATGIIPDDRKIAARIPVLEIFIPKNKRSENLLNLLTINFIWLGTGSFEIPIDPLMCFMFPDATCNNSS